jgi:NADH-quinone oxidoreductase subunit M
MKDVRLRELVTVVPLLGLSLFLGFYPNPVLDRVEPSIDKVIAQVEAGSDYEVPRIEPPVVEEAVEEEHE